MQAAPKFTDRAGPPSPARPTAAPSRERAPVEHNKQQEVGPLCHAGANDADAANICAEHSCSGAPTQLEISRLLTHQQVGEKHGAKN